MTGPIYRGRVFMYPCAGLDIPFSIQTFGELFDTFLFVDIRYDFKHLCIPLLDGWEEIAGTRKLVGKPTAQVRYVQSGASKYRQVEPAWLRVNYMHTQTGRKVEICLRRGFGQYALQEIADGTLGMFLHRGDSFGEGGSGVLYLANRPMSHPPLSRLFDVIKRKLTSPALIASDGSNTSVRQLRLAGRGDESIVGFTALGLYWQRKMTALRRGDSRTTVIWSVSSYDMRRQVVLGEYLSSTATQQPHDSTSHTHE